MGAVFPVRKRSVGEAGNSSPGDIPTENRVSKKGRHVAVTLLLQPSSGVTFAL